MTASSVGQTDIISELGGPWGTGIVAAIFVISLSVEAVVGCRAGKPLDGRRVAGNLWSTVLGLVLQPLAAIGYLALYAFVYANYRIYTFPMTIVSFIGLLLIWDLVHYVQHRMNHRIAILWAAHSVHHSAKSMDISVAPRKFWFWAVGFEPIYIVFAFFGISLTQMAIVSVITNLLSFIHHTRLVGKVPSVDGWLVTPSNHRVHHGTQAKYIDRNYGHVFMVFDRLFGTFQREEEEPVYGDGSVAPLVNPISFQFHGFVLLSSKLRACRTGAEIIWCVFGPPEWLPSRLRDAPFDPPIGGTSGPLLERV